MGGQGSGRKPDPVNLFKPSNNSNNDVGRFNLPNYSGIQDAAKKTSEPLSSLWEVDGTETQLITADAIDMQSNKIINVTDPTNNQDAATKKYVDDNAGGGILNTGRIHENNYDLADAYDDMIGDLGTTNGNTMTVSGGTAASSFAYISSSVRKSKADYDFGMWTENESSGDYDVIYCNHIAVPLSSGTPTTVSGVIAADGVTFSESEHISLAW